MSFEPEIADDCLLVDGTETVTLHGATTVVVEGARRGLLTLAETEFRQLGLESRDLAWNLPEVSLAGTEPRQGDTIEETSGARWTILSAGRVPLAGVWRTITRRQL